MVERVVLFDIDGTLLLTEGAGLRAMKRATHALYGERFRWDGMDTSGGLDPMLFAEAARRSGVTVGDGEHDRFRDLYLEHLPGEIVRSGPGVRAMPGVHALLETLRRRVGVGLGILTGNYPAAADIKLRAVAIDPAWFRFHTHGHEGTTRPQLGHAALEKLRAALGAELPPQRVVMVGDTPRDVWCARENGFLAVGVATGRYTVDELRAAGAHHAVPDLSASADLLQLIA